MYISFGFLPLCRQLDDLDSLTHQVQVQVQVCQFFFSRHDAGMLSEIVVIVTSYSY